MKWVGWASVALIGGCVAPACSSSEDSDGESGDGDTGFAGSGGDGDSSSGDGDSMSDIDIMDGNESPDGVACEFRTGDNDGDGFTIEDGDCNDCDINANPGAIDVPGNNVDENCDNIPDNQDLCDGDLNNPSSLDPLEAASALGLCATAEAEGRTWGVIDARYRHADGSEINSPAAQAGYAIIDHFGDVVGPREGDKLLSLSSGWADNLTAESESWKARSGYRQQTTVSPPAGFPVASSACPDVVLSDDPKANDSISFELTVRAPTNANSFSFDFNFYTYEFPDFVCHDFNDNFVVLMDPPPEGALNGNIAFDNRDNPISVNSAFLEVCDAEEAGLGAYTCPQGPDALVGTGYDVVPDLKLGKGGATGWLNTTVPIEPGSTFTLKFIIWDAGWSEAGMTGDFVNDAHVLVDNFVFSAEEASGTITKHIAL